MSAAAPIRRIAALATLLVAGACAVFQQSPPARDPSLLSTRPPPVGRACQVVLAPEELPAVAMLVDSVPLRKAIADLRAGEALGEGYVMLSLLYDRYGSNIRRAVIEHSLTSAVADTVQKLVFAHRRTLPAGEELGVRLRLDLADEVTMRVGRTEYCQPRARDLAVLSSWNVMRDRSPVMTARDETVWVRVFLDAQGAVAGARVERGILRAVAESQIFNYVRSLSFDPAILDGYPVPGTTVVPIVIRQR